MPLSEDHKKRLDSAAAADALKKSPLYPLIKEILTSYRERAITDLEEDAGREDDLEAVRMLRAVKALTEHLEAELETRISDVDNVCAEVGIDLNELRARRMVEDE